VTTALDEASGTATDTVYVTLQTLRARVHADITARLAGSARLLTFTPIEVQPALALAYDRYEDAERELEIIERNRLRHPGFVPAVPLRVLSI
jgi:prophage DNA circulation protein